jgi:hypothetical protein
MVVEQSLIQDGYAKKTNWVVTPAKAGVQTLGR